MILLIVFNVGVYRRNVVGADRKHDFFRPDNAEAIAIRRYTVQGLPGFKVKQRGIFQRHNFNTLFLCMKRRALSF